MKILLIAPASGKWKKIGRSGLFRGKTFRFSLLSLLSVAAETPPDFDIRIVDEQVDAIPWDENFDLVGITCMTAVAPRAYEISAQFRKKGIPVVLGGMHATFCFREAILHADAVLMGDAEGIWLRVLEDARNGRLHGIYKNECPPSLKGLKRPPRHLLKGKNYGTIQAVQATRGCANSCDFCSVAAFHGNSQRYRAVGEVRDEIEALPENFFIFVDDNLTADKGYAQKLFHALIPLGKKWITQSTLAVAEDRDFVKLAAKAGCIGLFVGLETFLEGNLEAVHKTCHRVGQYREAIRLLHSCGIGVEAGIVFGFDNDTPQVFRNTLDMLDTLEVDVVQVSIFTPLPGTPRFQSMQDRVLDRDWLHYDFHNVVFQPRKMTREDLQAGHDWVTREFYRPRRIARRLLRHIRRPGGLRTLPYHVGLNAAYYGRVVRWKIKGYDPARKKTGVPLRGPGHPAPCTAEARQAALLPAGNGK
jgi:radical SAM superfamily enzyme YgiQ (UPF0313 family)